MRDPNGEAFNRNLPLVFLGPSLPLDKAERLCAAEYRPPIRRGDLGRYAGPAPRIIGIVDGAFHQSLAVTPREVMAALGAGHRIYGAASMGALRAVELAYAGMIGVGCIYAAFASGATERDDEVAVTFDPETGRALSEPLIGMRHAFGEATVRGLLTTEEAATAETTAAGLHYPLRAYRRVVARLGLSSARREALLRFLEREATDLKADDARALLRRIAADRATPLAMGVARAQPPIGGGWGRGTHRHSVPRMGRGGAGRVPQVGSVSGAPPPPYALPPRARAERQRPTLASLPPAPKVPGWTSVRTVTAAQTDAVLTRVRARFGVSRVAEVTHLDTLGIPCYSAIIPGIGVSAYSGKSLERAEARVGAQMEALEAALQNDRRVPMCRATYADLAGQARALDPERLPIAGSERCGLRTVAFDWVEGWDLRSGYAVWVPADAVYAPVTTPPWCFSSNGLASGNCMAEALAHALAELIERDAETIQAIAAEYAHLPALLRLLAGRPRTSPPEGRHEPPVLNYPWIDLRTLPDPLRDTVGQIEQVGAAVDLRWVTSEIEVPVFQCLIHESHGPATMTHAGAGAHPDAVVAARRAITEAAQSRATFIHGVREDLSSPALKVQESPCGGWFDPRAPRVDFATLPSHAFTDVGEDLRYMAAVLARAGLDEIIAVDLSHPELPFAVVRVIVPGLEAPLELKNRERIALGWRARRYLTPRLERAS